MKTLVLAAALLTSGTHASAPATTIGGSAADTVRPFISNVVRSQLRSSAIPVLLPLHVPRSIGPIRSVSVITVGAAGYYVGFSSVVRCEGALSCAFFHVSGFRKTRDRSYGHDRHVRLPDGTRGYFRPGNCSGASCVQGALTFERDRAVYELDVKTGGDDFAVLVDIYTALRLIERT